MAGRHAERAREDIGDAIHLLRELRVAQRLVRRDQAGCIAATLRNPAIEQFNRAVHAIGIVQFRQREAEIRPLRARRQVIAREGIGLRAHCCRSSCSKLRSFPPKRESRTKGWVPAFAGTNGRNCKSPKVTPPPTPTFPPGSSTARGRSPPSALRSRLHRCAARGSRGKALPP